MNKKLQDLAKIYYGKSPGEVISRDGCIPIVGTGGVYGFAIEAMFDAGVVVARKGSLGKPSLQKSPFWAVDTTYAVIPNQDIDIDWLYYSLLNFDLTKLNEATGVPSISREWLSKINFRAPSTKEQKKIADCISSVDTTIEKTEALIEKYQQIKAGLMHDLFTRGVLPDGKLRPTREQAPELYRETGIGWVPKEWQYELLDKLAIRGSGHTPSKSHPEYWNGGIKWISLADSYRLDRLHISETDFEISQAGINNSSATIHPAGTVVLSRDAGVGKSAVMTEPMAVSQHFMCWRCDQNIDNYFLYYWLQNNKRLFENIAMGSTILTIGLSYFKKLRIACPINIGEQKIIAEKIKAVDFRLQTLGKELNKKKDQKNGLMHDLLTGKVAVKVDQETTRGELAT
jgi:type I restriction enzyme S subunit